MRKRQFPLHQGGRREPEAFADVFDLKVGILGDDLALGETAREQTQHGRDGDAQIAHARYSAHLRRIYSDTSEVRHFGVNRPLSQADRTPAMAANSIVNGALFVGLTVRGYGPGGCWPTCGTNNPLTPDERFLAGQ